MTTLLWSLVSALSLLLNSSPAVVLLVACKPLFFYSLLHSVSLSIVIEVLFSMLPLNSLFLIVSFLDYQC